MDAHIVKRNRGKIVGSSYRLDEFSGSLPEAIAHLKCNGFNDEEASAYLKALPIQNESV